jgi:hypothetical protein
MKQDVIAASASGRMSTDRHNPDMFQRVLNKAPAQALAELLLTCVAVPTYSQHRPNA